MDGIKRKKNIVILAAVCAVLAVGGGAAATMFLRHAPKTASAPVVDQTEYKYVTLDKVIVMLRGDGSVPHYLAIDLVFKTPAASEQTTKEHLPLLRSLAVKTLSAYTMERAQAMTIDEVAAALNKAFAASYTAAHGPKPFAEAMIGKLIIE